MVAAPAPPPVVTLTAVDYAFTAPDTIVAGVTAFRLVNDGSQLHMAQLIKLEGGRSLDDFLVAYTEASARPVPARPGLHDTAGLAPPTRAAAPTRPNTSSRAVTPGSAS